MGLRRCPWWCPHRSGPKQARPGSGRRRGLLRGAVRWRRWFQRAEGSSSEHGVVQFGPGRGRQRSEGRRAVAVIVGMLRGGGLLQEVDLEALPAEAPHDDPFEGLPEVTREESVDEGVDGRVAVPEPEEDREQGVVDAVIAEGPDEVHGEEGQPADDEAAYYDGKGFGRFGFHAKPLDLHFEVLFAKFLGRVGRQVPGDSGWSFLEDGFPPRVGPAGRVPYGAGTATATATTAASVVLRRQVDLER